MSIDYKLVKETMDNILKSAQLVDHSVTVLDSGINHNGDPLSDAEKLALESKYIERAQSLKTLVSSLPES